MAVKPKPPASRGQLQCSAQLASRHTGASSPRRHRLRSACRAVEAHATRIEIDTQELRQNVTLAAIPSGKDTFVVFRNVVQGSGAWEAGLRPGQRLSAISDPNRVQNVWQLDGTSSPRFIKQALRLQLAPTINIEYEDSSFGTDAAAPLSDTEADAPTGEAASSVDILDSMLGSDASEDERAQDSVAEQLERTLQRDRAQKSRVQERMDARKDALAQVGDRDDSKFFAAVAAAFFLPPLVLLVWAAQSGFLDSLATRY